MSSSFMYDIIYHRIYLAQQTDFMYLCGHSTIWNSLSSCSGGISLWFRLHWLPCEIIPVSLAFVSTLRAGVDLYAHPMVSFFLAFPLFITFCHIMKQTNIPLKPACQDIDSRLNNCQNCKIMISLKIKYFLLIFNYHVWRILL